MTQEHSITPPPELVEQWRATPEYTDLSEKIFVVSLTTKKLQDIATQAAQWGADQELEASCEWLSFYSAASDARDLRIARRPKPPSPKNTALEALAEERSDMKFTNYQVIRSALESIPND